MGLVTEKSHFDSIRFRMKEPLLQRNGVTEKPMQCEHLEGKPNHRVIKKDAHPLRFISILYGNTKMKHFFSLLKQ